MKILNRVRAVTVLLLIILALLSFFGVSKVATSTAIHQKEIATIDEKIENVMELSAITTLGSVVTSMLPGDVATPISDKLSDFGTFFVIILAVLYLEKYLLCITGYASFGILIPLACLGGVWVQYDPNPHLKNLIKRLVWIALAIYLVIPASVRLSNVIDNTYANTLSQTIESANNTINNLGEASSSDSDDDQKSSNFISGVLNTVSQKIQEAKKMVNNMIESVAVLLVTSCLIPLLVLMFFWFMIKSILGDPGISFPPRIGIPPMFKKPEL